MDSMELKDTIEMMQSVDYRERFKAEYYQVLIRRNKLKEMLRKYDTNQLDFTPTCPIDLLNDQLYHMNNYLMVLYQRAQIEGIEL